MRELEPESPGTPAVRPTPEVWDFMQVFRETFLCHFDHRRDIAALRRVGELLYDVAQDLPFAHKARLQLRGALADLRHLEGLCKDLVRYDKAMRLTPGEHRLCLYAGELAEALGELAGALAQELARRSRRS
jgi:hypothetical protein